MFVSAASVWETIIKLALGKLRFEGSIGDAVKECVFRSCLYTRITLNLY